MFWFWVGVLHEFLSLTLKKRKKKRKKLSYYVVVILIFVNKKNTGPGVQQERKLGDNQSGMLQTCSPQKIKKKLICKAGGFTPKDPPKPKDKPAPPKVESATKACSS
jgi:hypothetical protein